MQKFNIGVVGCGSMAQTWIEYARQRKDCEIKALVDLDLDQARKTKKEQELSGADTFSDINTMHKQHDLNLVFDITPPEAHYETVTKSLSAGCHVLGEKPMASSMDEAREMVARAEKTGLTYAVMQNRRYNKNIRSLRHMIKEGIIGKPGLISSDFFIGAHFEGFRTEMDSPLILDMAVHTFDQARFIMNSDPVSVYCQESNPPGSWYKGKAAASAIFEFDDGSIYTYSGSWCAEGAQTSWEADWRVNGSRGSLLWDGEKEPRAEIVISEDEDKFINDFQTVTPEYKWQGQNGHQGCLDEMFSGLKEGYRPETDCRDNIKTMAMVFGALESSQQGKKINIEVNC